MSARDDHQHLSDEQLRDMVNGLTDADDFLRLRDEVKDCSRCLRAYRSLRRGAA